MGDRTWAWVRYPAWADPLIAERGDPGRTDIGEFFGEKRKLAYDDNSWEIDSESDQHTSWLGECDCNYGTHPQVEVLRELGIPFDTGWDNGGEYSAGEGHARVGTDGRLIEYEWSQEGSDHELARLVSAFANHGKEEALKLLKEIANHGYFAQVTPIAKVQPTAEQAEQLRKLRLRSENAAKPAQQQVA